MKRSGVVFWIFLLIMSLYLLVGAAFASDGTGLRRAPLSPAFLAYLEGQKREDAVQMRGADAEGRAKGYIPSPVDLSHLRSADYSSYFSGNRRRAPYPEKYDLRDVNGISQVTSVKNQEPYNNCWAFSAIGSLESAYLKKTGTALDLSEMHLSYYTFKDSSGFTSRTADVLLNGGFDNMSVATMARWTGPVLESSVPYGRVPIGSASSYPNRLHLQDAYFLSLQFMTGQPQPTNDIRKELISSYGAISVGFYASGKADVVYNASTAAWCNRNAPPSSADHAVLAVGWDDSYSRENFNANSRPDRDGAWLIKNSWGAGWGQGGYFWLSYEDSSLGDGAVYLPEEVTNYDNIYGHDDLGWCSALSGENNTAWMANVFTARSEETLQAVSFYTTNVNAQYEISVYSALSNVNAPLSGTKVSSQTGAQSLAGYHTVPLNTPVSLSAGTVFSVVVRMTTPGYEYPIAIEYPIPGYSAAAASLPGESFYSLNGSSWLDLSEASMNACVKAFTSGHADPLPDGTEKAVVSENAGDWIRQMTANTVMISGRIDVTDGDITNVTVYADGLANAKAAVDNAPRSDAPAGKVYYTLNISGAASNLSDVALRGLSFTQRGTQYRQTFRQPVYLQTNTSSNSSGGGCSAGAGLFAFAAFAGVLLKRSGRRGN